MHVDGSTALFCGLSSSQQIFSGETKISAIRTRILWRFRQLFISWNQGLLLWFDYALDTIKESIKNGRDSGGQTGERFNICISPDSVTFLTRTFDMSPVSFQKCLEQRG